MANDGKFINLTSGKKTQESAVNASAGAADANKIPKLDGGGKLDPSLMPAGVLGEARQIAASEAIAAGALINLYNAAGVLKVRNADASANKPAHGYVLAAIANAATGTVYEEQGTITGLAGLVIGSDYWLSAAAPGAVVNATPAAPNAAQQVGIALSATELLFSPGDFIVQV